MKLSMRKNKKLWIAVGSSAAAVLIILVVVMSVIYYQKTQDSTVYKETVVQYGNLMVGITEDSTVSIGTIEQTFDLDISALISKDSSSSDNSHTNSTTGGMGMMNFGMNANYQTKQQSIEIESVVVTAGSHVSAGDVLYTLKQEDVDEIRTQLEEDVEDTKATYEALQIEQQETQLQAKQGYDTYVTNGKLADIEYQADVADLEATLKEASDELDDISKEIDDNLEDIVDYQYRLKKARESLADAEAGVEDLYDDRLKEAYYYITFENAREDAKELVEEYEDKIEELEDKNQELVYEMQTKARSVSQAQRDLESGTLDAEQTKAVDIYYQSVASEWYDIQMTSLTAKLADAEYNYQSAENKLSQFNAEIVGNHLVAEYDGVITSVPLEAGDSITMNTTLITLYDQSEVTMEVTLSEEDKDTVINNQGIVIAFDAYADTLYEAELTDIGDATYDSSSKEVYYTVTITLKGDVSGLYEGMTGDVTFITNEAKEVTYVSNRAIFEEETEHYVKIRDEKGNIVKKTVETGFTDGTNTEIIEGLSEGDVVLIESKVKES